MSPQQCEAPPPAPYAPVQSSLSFTQGLLVGQLSVVLLIGAFIKFFIFGEPPPSSSRGPNRRSSSLHNIGTGDGSSRSLREKPSNSNVLRPVPSSSTNTRSILRKTYYSTIPTNPSSKHGRNRMHHSSHQPESLDWFNVLVAQTIAQYRQTAYILKDSPTSSILDSLTATLNNPEKKPSFIDKITVTDISLGEEFPIFSNCRVIAVDDPNSDGGRLQALMDVDLSDDNLSIAIETNLILNYPKPRSAVLPVALSVSVVRFSGTLCISFVPAQTPPSHTPSPSPPPANAASGANARSSSRNGNARSQRSSSNGQEDPAASQAPGNGTPKTNLALSFLPDYRLDLSVRSLIGSRSRLQDVPKVAQLVEARVHAWFEERVVEPRVQVIGLPDFWPRMGRTGVRQGEESSDPGSAAAAACSAAASRPAGAEDIDVSFRSDCHERYSDDREMEGLRYRGGGGTGGLRPGLDGAASRASGFSNGAGPSGLLRSRSMTPGGGSSSSASEQFQMPGSMPDGVAVT
ncbi:maintenance of mitochondrial morphology protein 1 [Thermoascus aurantiacus ATCC 26904]